MTSGHARLEVELCLFPNGQFASSEIPRNKQLPSTYMKGAWHDVANGIDLAVAKEEVWVLGGRPKRGVSPLRKKIHLDWDGGHLVWWPDRAPSTTGGGVVRTANYASPLPILLQ